MSAVENSKADFLNNRLDMVDQPIVLATMLRESIPTPAEGMMIVDPDVGAVVVYRSGAWRTLAEV